MTPRQQLGDEPFETKGRSLRQPFGEMYQSLLFFLDSVRQKFFSSSQRESSSQNRLLQYINKLVTFSFCLLYTGAIKAPLSPNRTVVKFTVVK